MLPDQLNNQSPFPIENKYPMSAAPISIATKGSKRRIETCLRGRPAYRCASGYELTRDVLTKTDTSTLERCFLQGSFRAQASLHLTPAIPLQEASSTLLTIAYRLLLCLAINASFSAVTIPIRLS